MNYQKKLSMYHTWKHENNESKDNNESSTEDDGEVVDEYSDAEYSDPNEETIIQTRDWGKDHLALLRTG